KVPTTKGKNLTILIAVSATYGKIFMMTTHKNSQTTFQTFINKTIQIWQQKSNSKQTPIFILDNFRVHNLPQNNFVFLPSYSPMLNVVEPINHLHKLE